MSHIDDLNNLLNGRIPPERPEKPSVGRQIWRVVKWTLLIFVGFVVFALWFLTRTNPGESLSNAIIGGGIGLVLMMLYRELDVHRRDTAEKLRVMDRRIVEILEIMRRIGR